jgi:uncharacterized membrane protein YccC
MPGLRDWLFSIKTFAAAMLALYLGFLMSVPRPYWAMATVYICSHPLSGATRSKSAYRVLGTLIGAVAAVVMVPNLVDAPELLVLALAGWTALCLFVSLFDRTPRSYVFMLGGYTAALIGFPAVSDPASIFDLAIARVEEISLGIICASLVSTLVLPRSVGGAVAGRINLWLGESARFALDALAGRRDPETAQRDLIGLAGAAAEIDMLSTHLKYEIAASPATRHAIEALRQRLLLLLPTQSSIADRMQALRDSATDLPPELDHVITRLRGWIRPEAPSLAPEDQRREVAEADALRQAIIEAEPGLGVASGWPDLLLANLLTRLRELVDIASDCRLLRRAVALGRPVAGRLHVDPGRSIASAHHRDMLLPLLSAFGVALAIILTSAVWILTGWPDGSSAPMMAAVACSFFASRDDPAPAIVEFALWSAVAIVMIGIYLFAILPFVHDFEILALVLAPAYLVIGLMMAMPRTMSKGLALGANGSTLMALQGSYTADFPSFANGAIAFLIGMTLAAVLMRLMRSVGAEWSVRRLIRAESASLAAAAARHQGVEGEARLTALMLDRIGLMAPRLAALPPGHDLARRDVLAEPRIGLNIVALGRVRPHLAATAAAAIDRVLAGLATTFGTTVRDGAAMAARRAALVADIDDGLRAVLAGADSAERRQAILGLVGIRRGLCPGAEPYRPGGEGPVEPSRSAPARMVA